MDEKSIFVGAFFYNYGNIEISPEASGQCQ